MVKYIAIISTCLIFFASRNLLAQSDSSDFQFDASEISNQIFLRTDENIFSEQLQFLADEIERISLSPILISTARWKDLLSIPTLTDIDILNIKKTKGDNSLRSDELDKSQRFIKSSLVRSSQNYVFIRSKVIVDPDAHEDAVYRDHIYRGSPVKTISRVIAKNEDILIALVEAKDAGEPLYFDHVSGCIALNNPVSLTNVLNIEKCVLGDYSLSFGSGLLFSSAYLPQHDIHAAVSPRVSGIAPYISSSSFRYFRGAASEVSAGIISVGGFFSDRNVDATTDSGTITSLYSNGYHRTTSELSRKEKVQSKVAGAHISLVPLDDDSYFEIGATGYTLDYDRPVIIRDSSLTAFHGQHHSMASVEIRSAFSFFSLSGEYANMISDAGKEHAIVVSSIISPLDFLELSMNYRNLPVNFISPFGSTFGINTNDAQNETGWYIGSTISIIPRCFYLFGSLNIARTQNPGNIDLHYSNIRIGGKYKLLSFPLEFFAEVRSYGKGKIFSIQNDSISKNTFRLVAKSNITKSIRISQRIEFERYTNQLNIPEDGYLAATKIEYIPFPEISISSGISVFQTDSYSSRFYSNETDLPGSVPFVALYGRGNRYYIQCSYKPLASVELSARAAETQYRVSPANTILHKATVGLQCDVSL
jgi:hypothetical protein